MQTMSLLPSLLRLCSAPQTASVLRAPFLSLTTFNPALSCPAPPVSQRRWYAGRSSSVVAKARRNIFLDPKEIPSSSTDTSLSDLYDSSRFNDDDDEWEQQQQQQQEQEQQQAAAGSSGGPARPAGPALPRAKNTKVKTAEFIKSSVTVKDCPKAGLPEFAVIGRSNVGKSSLINMLTGRKSLAMVSKTPGKTRCINHFLINDSWYLVDLPGYGYAKSSKENVMGWNKFTREYFTERETLVAVLLLVDASIPPMEIDVACADWFGDAEIPYSVVFTKIDKRKKGCPPAVENIEAFQQELLKNWEELPNMLVTSSRSGQGKGELLGHIAQLREAFLRQ